MTQQNLEIEGVKNLKSGTLFYLISAMLFIVSFALIITQFGISTNGILSEILGSAGSVLFLILEVAGFATTVLAFLRTRRGFSQLKMAGRKVGGKTAATLIIVGYATLFIGSIVALALLFLAERSVYSSVMYLNSSSAAGTGLGLGSTLGELKDFIIGALVVLAIGALIIYIGYIMLASAYKDVGTLYNVGTLRTGGNLMFIGFILFLPSIIPFVGGIFGAIGGILVFIGNIMVYLGLGTLLVMLQSGRYPGFYQPYYGQPYQGAPLPPQYPPLQPFNRIYGNGVAEVNVYSPEPVQVTSATIIGTSYSSNQVTPTNLAPGNNVIRISFNGQLNLVPGNVYTIQITLSNGQLITVNAAYQP
ncbi:MAG: DUF973 family protein [Metallosphaera sp.]|uniref:DUF973 family protein n=1 Tax=Metallosphaera sp. TaxID=2020860 RepID=UPI0031645A58